MIRTKHFIVALTSLSIAIGALWVVVLQGFEDCRKDRASLRALIVQRLSK